MDLVYPSVRRRLASKFLVHVTKPSPRFFPVVHGTEHNAQTQLLGHTIRLAHRLVAKTKSSPLACRTRSRVVVVMAKAVQLRLAERRLALDSKERLSADSMSRRLIAP
jgi:hypothetical protein